MLVMNGDIACQKVILIIILDYRDDEWGLLKGYIDWAQ